jgi:hypothetical protein
MSDRTRHRSRAADWRHSFAAQLVWRAQLTNRNRTVPRTRRSLTTFFNPPPEKPAGRVARFQIALDGAVKPKCMRQGKFRVDDGANDVGHWTGAKLVRQSLAAEQIIDDCFEFARQVTFGRERRKMLGATAAPG